MVLRADRGAGRHATAGARPLAGGARRTLRHDAVGDRPPRERGAPAADRHAAPCLERSRLQPRRRAQAANRPEGGRVVSTYASRLDLEEIEITKTEKLLAVVLTVFFLIGGAWAYAKVDNVVRSEFVPVDSYLTAEEHAAVDRASEAQGRLDGAEQALTQARLDLEHAREAYRTALDAGEPATRLESAYRAAEADYSSAQAEVDRARSDVLAAQPAADAAYARASEEARDASVRGELITFAARLGAAAHDTRLRVLAAHPPAWLGLPLPARRVRHGRLRRPARARHGRRLRRPSHRRRAARPARSLDRRHRTDAGNVLVASALSGTTDPAASCAEERVPVLRVPRPRRRALRGMRTIRRR